MKVLYLTYDGLCDPLGRSQIIPYLKGLALKDVHFTIISLEKKNHLTQNETEIRALFNKLNINWLPLNYIQSDSGWKALLNIASLYLQTRKFCRKEKPDFIHCRSYIPAFIAKKLQIPYLFDIRGFWIDERVEGKMWSLDNPLYKTVFRFLKKKEPALYADAAHIISLTRKAIPRIRNWAPKVPVSVIPCIADPVHFTRQAEMRAEARKRLEIKDSAEVLVYLGSLGSWYLPEEMMDFFRIYQKNSPDAIFLLITPENADTLFRIISKKNLNQASIRFLKAKHDDVPLFLAAADLAISFIRDLPSKEASSPTKIAEYALMGLPIIYNAVGDLANQAVAGALVHQFSDENYRKALLALKIWTVGDPRIRQKALETYNPETALNTYFSAYQSILSLQKHFEH